MKAAQVKNQEIANPETSGSEICSELPESSDVKKGSCGGWARSKCQEKPRTDVFKIGKTPRTTSVNQKRTMKAAQVKNQKIANPETSGLEICSKKLESLMSNKGLAEVGQDAEQRVGNSLADVFNLAKPVVGLAAKPEGTFSGDLKGETALSAKTKIQWCDSTVNHLAPAFPGLSL
jgi:hypothetical protein